MSKADELLGSLNEQQAKKNGDMLQEFANKITKKAKNLASIGRAWSKTDDSDIKSLLRHEGVAQNQVDDLKKILGELNSEFGR